MGEPCLAGAPLRRCTKCLKDRPLAFYAKKGHRCRPCRTAYMREWNARHPGYAQQKSAEWASRQKAERDARIVQRYGSLEEYNRRRSRTFAERYAEDPEFRERQRAKTRAWREQNPEAAAELDRRKRQRAAQRKEGLGDLVYFIRAASGGPVKIGYTSRNPEHRLQGLNTGHWEVFRIIGVLFGDRRVESDLHYRFRDLRIRGEWFRDEPMLLEFIADSAIPWSTVP